jgi:hypothetical protein
MNDFPNELLAIILSKLNRKKLVKITENIQYISNLTNYARIKPVKKKIKFDDSINFDLKFTHSLKELFFVIRNSGN